MREILFQLFGLLDIVLIFIIYFSKQRIENIENKIYKKMIEANLIGQILHIMSYFTIMYTPNNGLLNTIVTKAYILYLITWALLLTTYVLVVSLSKPTKEEPKIKISEKQLNIVKRVIFISIIISYAIIIILPIYSNNVPGKIYTYGPSVEYIYIASPILVVVCLTTMLIRFDKNKLKKYIPLCVFVIIGTISMIVQKINPEILLITSIETFITLLMYFTIENPDVKMLEEVSIAKDIAEKANSAKTDFLSNMSHEIRTPLNAIVGFSESLKEDPIPEASKDKVNDILIASNNLLEIVNGILDISKIEANKLEIVNKEYDVHSMFDELISLTKARIGDRGLDFKVKIDPSLPSVLYGDNTRIKQVILNILTNAVKYTKEGFVEFTVSTIIKDNICRLIISVEDSGIGIKEESIPKLFSKFERLNVEKQITIEGTGLGLAISKKLLELMNGKIIVQSVYGKGSKFTISIDQRIIAIETPATKQPAKTESKHIDANGAKVLLVDDNELNIKVAATLLKKYNFTIDSCTSAYACFAKINNGEKFDVILMDDMMPKMTGKEAVKKLKSDPNFKTPVIVLTANAITGMREEYLAAGFDDYLSKPIEKKELERVIKEHINVTNSVQMNSSLSRATNSIFENKIEIENPISTEPTFSYSKNKILLVDDNEVNLKVALTTLKKYNLDITTVTSGSECIEKVITEKYDLILLDDMMPELDGCTTLENLKSIEDFNTPTIMMTASSKDEVQEKLEKYGFDGYLSKPFNRNDLEEILDSFLN